MLSRIFDFERFWMDTNTDFFRLFLPTTVHPSFTRPLTIHHSHDISTGVLNIRQSQKERGRPHQRSDYYVL
jgi:hypothetical protein